MLLIILFTLTLKYYKKTSFNKTITYDYSKNKFFFYNFKD